MARTFGAPGYINRDASLDGSAGPHRTPSTATDGGNKYLENIVANYASGSADHEFSGVRPSASHDIFNRYADFGGGQRWQQDERTHRSAAATRKVWTGESAAASGATAHRHLFGAPTSSMPSKGRPPRAPLTGR